MKTGLRRAHVRQMTNLDLGDVDAVFLVRTAGCACERLNLRCLADCGVPDAKAGL